MISVIILTKNEERDIPPCLMALSWCHDIHILDSGSTDKTIEIASAYGAKVSNNKFISFAQQRNFALDNLVILHDWILFLDADEVMTENFHQAIMEAVSKADQSIAGFYCCWKMMLEERWLKHCDNFPKWQFRLLRKGRARFIDFGHGQKEDMVIGRIGYIKEPYLHFAFTKGWSQWIERHNRYSSLEAIARLDNPPPIKDMFSNHSSVRNPALKSFLIKFPGWPFLRFFQAYLLNLGFLEGIPGFIYCSNIAYYEFLIQIKIREIRKSRKLKI
jgi:glycosyltransferase involved in cell wall biosynthesis